MRVGWKVRRLTKKELCQNNETWHAVNSAFPDTNCTAFFQINPHWISNSGLWKVVLEKFCEYGWNWRRESRFTRTTLLHTSLWLQWLLCVTDWLWLWAGWSPSIFSWFGTIWLFSVPQYEKTLGCMRSYLQSKVFWGSGWELLYHGNASAATPLLNWTPMEEVCGLQGRLCWKINHIRSNLHVNQWGSQQNFTMPGHG